MKTETPRTNALLLERRNELKPDVWATDDVQAFLSLCRQLERELDAQYDEAVEQIFLKGKAELERDKWREMAQEAIQELKIISEAYANNEPVSARWATDALARFNELNEKGQR